MARHEETKHIGAVPLPRQDLALCISGNKAGDILDGALGGMNPRDPFRIEKHQRIRIDIDLDPATQQFARQFSGAYVYSQDLLRLDGGNQKQPQGQDVPDGGEAIFCSHGRELYAPRGLGSISMLAEDSIHS